VWREKRPDPAFVTAADFTVDGGMTRKMSYGAEWGR
jgi:hypothetical protein